jgi:thioredoxin reductase
MYDIIIVGGGPAGSIAAERAARDGLDDSGKRLVVTASSICRQRCYHEPIAI